MAQEMVTEPCGDTRIDPDVQAFMDIHAWKRNMTAVWPSGSPKPIATVDVVDELL